MAIRLVRCIDWNKNTANKIGTEETKKKKKSIVSCLDSQFW